MKRRATLLVALALLPGCCIAQSAANWRTATPDELSAVLPARAPVARERIESEMRTASGIVNGRGQLIASVLLITAGYAAEGKFSHYLLTQQPMRIGTLDLAPGAYVIGWSRTDDGLLVHIYDAATVTDRGTVLARPLAQPGRIESFRIWPPAEKSYIQIGRYKLPYSVTK
jgi:hypothetical protein